MFRGSVVYFPLVSHAPLDAPLNCQRVGKGMGSEKKDIFGFCVLSWGSSEMSQLPTALQGQAILSGPGGLDGTAAFIVFCPVFCALSEVCLLFYWTWSCGRVFRSPPASQPQTMLSGAGGLRDPATLSVVFIFSRLHIVGLCLKYVRHPVFGGVVKCFGLPHPSIPGSYCLELDG